MQTKFFMITGLVALLSAGIVHTWNDLDKIKAISKKKEDKRRRITTDEYQFALTIFEREFPPRDIITITNETGFGGRPYVRPTVDGHIRINLGAAYDNPLGNKNLFVHELTHAWQIEHYGLVWYGKQAVANQVIAGDPYNYVCDASKTLSHYNAEQQGEIVKDYYNKNACATSIARSLRSATWKLLIGSDAVDMTVDAGGTYYMVNTAGLIYRYTGNDWQQLSGSAGKKIAANGGKVCLINSSGKIYQLSGNSWNQMPGSDGRDIAINNDGTIWLTNTAGKIYRFNGSSWSQMPGSDAVRIAAGGGQVWMVNTAGKIYRFTNSRWTQTAGSDGRDVTVSNDGKIFLTNTVGKIYQWNGTAWTQLDGSDGISVSANAGKLVMTNTKGRMYYRSFLTKKILAAPIKSREIRQ